MLRMHARPRFTVLGLLVFLATPPTGARAAVCPNEVLFEPTAASATLDAGWQGFAHDQAMFGTTLPLAVSCAASTPPCGTCAIVGVVPNPAGHRLRCATDTAIECSVATELTDCGAAGACRYYLSPPQSLGTGGLPFCATIEVAGPVSGSVGVESGAFAPTVPMQIRVYEWVAVDLDGGPNQGCPRCAGDVVANDGTRAGTCDAGPRAGLSCDAHDTSPRADFGSASFDCPPEGPPVTQFAVVTAAFSTTPQSVTLTAASPACSPPDNLSRCFCSTCNNAAAEPCFTSSDCPPSGGNPGACGGRRCIGGGNHGTPCTQSSECPSGACGKPGEPIRPNACLDDTVNPDDCTPDGNAGFCAAGPIVSYCTNHPNRGCGEDADCDGVPGACTSFYRTCYPDNGVIGRSVAVAGTATPPVDGIAFPTALGALACLGPSPDLFVQAWGLPGLARIHQPGRLILAATAADPCPPTPSSCRAPTAVGKGSLRLTDRTPDDKDQLAWKWAKGAATTLADLGDPLGSDAYALCVYDGPTLRATLEVPAGGLCRGRPCWQQRASGFTYRNQDAAPYGITQLTLKAGAAGKAQMQAKGNGALLPIPPPPSLTGALRVQLRNRTDGICWGTLHVPPFDQATAEQLRDKSD